VIERQHWSDRRVMNAHVAVCGLLPELEADIP
jgi:hypothetical protein